MAVVPTTQVPVLDGGLDAGDGDGAVEVVAGVRGERVGALVELAARGDQHQVAQPEVLHRPGGGP